MRLRLSAPAGIWASRVLIPWQLMLNLAVAALTAPLLDSSPLWRVVAFIAITVNALIAAAVTVSANKRIRRIRHAMTQSMQDLTSGKAIVAAVNAYIANDDDAVHAKPSSELRLTPYYQAILATLATATTFLQDPRERREAAQAIAVLGERWAGHIVDDELEAQAAHHEAEEILQMFVPEDLELDELPRGDI